MRSFYLCLFLFCTITRTCHGNPYVRKDTLIQGQTLRDLEELESARRTYTLQFSSFHSNSKDRYLVILGRYWSSYREGTDVVWVANRNNPIPDTSGRLVIDPKDSSLKILHDGGTLSVSSTALTTRPKSIGGKTSATLLDNGNFVLRQLNSDGSINSTLWQSFDHPTDTLLPGMKIGINFRTGQNWTLTSWMHKRLPASGIFTLSIDPNGTDQLIMWWRGSIYWTSGLFHEGRFDNMLSKNCYSFSYISNQDEKLYTYSNNCDDIDSTGLTLTSSGDIEGSGERKDDCFKFSPEGCIRQELPECRTRHGDFTIMGSYDGYNFDGESYTFNESLNLSLFECQAKCLANCSCVAFGSTTEKGTGCEIWSRVNHLETKVQYKRILYTLQTMPAKRKWWIWLITAIAGAATLSSAILFCYVKRRKLINIKGKIMKTRKLLKQLVESTCTSLSRFTARIDDKAICLFRFESMMKATNDFSDANKLGEGGFGPVYKGTLPCGQEVAIKRLSKNSGQGLVEFQTEVLLISKLQHTNLVKLIGSCIQRQETILVYEYMPNKSLDHFLFDSSRRELLKWTIRMRIIEGVAQGLLYLHKYSRLKVIHRDLKAGNVLLDHNMSPKISDFGMAKIFETQELEANTKRIVGTCGYMSPEYIINGIVSLKTDIFSFGVLVLEIISGKKSRDSYDNDRPLNLIGLAWELWIEGRAMELIDESMDDYLRHKSEVMKCIHIGLLCVQDSPADRPSMMDVVSMLTNGSTQLPSPKQPAFFIETSVGETNDEITPLKKQSINEVSITLMEAR